MGCPRVPHQRWSRSVLLSRPLGGGTDLLADSQTQRTLAFHSLSSFFGHANQPNRFTNLPKKTTSSGFHAHVPPEVSDNPFASIEALRGSPPSSPLHKPFALTPVTRHVPLIPTAESFVPHKGAVSTIPSKQGSTSGGSSLSGNAKAFIPRSSTAYDVQFSGIPFENIDRVPGRVAIRKVDDAFVGAAGIIGRGA